MKILVLIFIDDIYNIENIKNKWLQYINIFPNISYYFVKYKDEDKNILPIWNNDTTIFIKNKKISLYEKNILIFNHLINSNIYFDYILNTKITSFIILENLISFLIFNNGIDYAGIYSNKKIANSKNINNLTHKYYPSNIIFLISKKSVYDIIQYHTLNSSNDNNNNIIYKILSFSKFKKIKKQNINKKIINKNIVINNNCIIYNFTKNISIVLIDNYINNLVNIFYNYNKVLLNINEKIKNIYNEYNKKIVSKINITLNYNYKDDTTITNTSYELLKIPLKFTKMENNEISIIDDIIECIKNNNIKKNVIMFKKFIEQYKKCDNLNKKIDFTEDIDLCDLNIINDNIDNFVNSFIEYSKVLIVCNYTIDNYNNLIKLNELFSKKNIELHIFFLNSNNQDKKEYNIHFLYLNINDEIKNIKFKPNIVICIDDINYNFKKIYDCFIITIFTKTLENNIEKIKHIITYSDLFFTYSDHIKKFISNTFNIDVYLFYFYLIKFYGKYIENDNNFKYRKYNFGLKINNNENFNYYEREFNYLKNKNNVIILNDVKTVKNNFIDTSEYNFDIYKISQELITNVKYIVKHDNIINDFDIECFLNGCILIKNFFTINYNDINKSIEIKKNNKYIIGNFTNIYNNIYLPKLFVKNSYEGYIINNDVTKEILIFIYLDYDININIIELFKKINLNNEQIGINTYIYNDCELINMYYLFGLGKLDKNIFGLNLFYENYTNELENNIFSRKFNKNIFKLTTSYYYGINNKNISNIYKDFEKASYHQQNMLLISKIIKGYGGVQKSSKQIIETFDKIYNIRVISNNLNSDNFDYEIDNLDNDIHNCIIIKNKNSSFLINIIDSNEYSYILNNKLKRVL